MPDEIIRLPINLVSESPTNPRRHFDAAGLQELADSIRANGIAQPVLVRPTGDSYELVFGHRRLRAAKLAGEDFIPAMCRQMTSDEAAQLQLVENLQRADVTAAEEAEGFAAMVREHGVSPEDLAARVGKSRTYVYNRLKLASATPEVLSAVNDSQLTPEVATLIARVPAPLQQRAIKAVQDVVLSDDGKRIGTECASYREARRRLAQGFTVALNEAPPWGMEAVCATSQRACQTCPARSDNDPALLEALGAGVCTDQACYQLRADAHVRMQVEWAQAAGRTVIQGDEAVALAPYQGADWLLRGYCYARTLHHAFDRTWADLMDEMGADAPRADLLVDPHRPGRTHDVLSPAAQEVIEAWAREHLALASDDDEDDDAGTADDPPEPPDVQRAMDPPTWLRARQLMVAGLADRQRTTDDLRLIIELLLEAGLEPNEEKALSELTGVPIAEAGEDDGAPGDWLLRALPTLSADALGRVAVALALWNVVPPDYAWGPADRCANADRRIELARTYGVDLLHPDGPKPIEPESPPPSAARAPKGAGQGKRERPAARAAAEAVDTRTLPLPLDGPAAQEVMDEAAAPPATFEGRIAWPTPKQAAA